MRHGTPANQVTRSQRPRGAPHASHFGIGIQSATAPSPCTPPRALVTPVSRETGRLGVAGDLSGSAPRLPAIRGRPLFHVKQFRTPQGIRAFPTPVIAHAVPRRVSPSPSPDRPPTRRPDPSSHRAQSRRVAQLPERITGRRLYVETRRNKQRAPGARRTRQARVVGPTPVARTVEWLCPRRAGRRLFHVKPTTAIAVKWRIRRDVSRETTSPLELPVGPTAHQSSLDAFVRAEDPIPRTDADSRVQPDPRARHATSRQSRRLGPL